MKDNEAVYDEQIAPLMAQIIAVCNEHGIPLFAEFQYSPDGFCKTAIAGAGSHAVFQSYAALSQCKEDAGVNIDKFMFWVVKQAGEQGHSSIWLRQAGIPIAGNLAANEKPG